MSRHFRALQLQRSMPRMSLDVAGRNLTPEHEFSHPRHEGGEKSGLVDFLEHEVCRMSAAAAVEVHHDALAGLPSIQRSVQVVIAADRFAIDADDQIERRHASPAIDADGLQARALRSAARVRIADDDPVDAPAFGDGVGENADPETGAHAS